MTERQKEILLALACIDFTLGALWVFLVVTP